MDMTHDVSVVGIAPMAPLGSAISRRNSNSKPGFSPYESHNIHTINTNGKIVTRKDWEIL